MEAGGFALFHSAVYEAFLSRHTLLAEVVHDEVQVVRGFAICSQVREDLHRGFMRGESDV